MRSGLQDVVRRTVAKYEYMAYMQLIIDDIYLLLMLHRVKASRPVGQKSQSLGDRFSSLGDIYVTQL